MSKIATHTGSCQGCGHTQKLPGGKLSLHGYTVAWGFFSGTCDGARELPYELSCDYCKTCIVRATAQRNSVLDAAKHYRRVITEAVADTLTVSLGRNKQTFKTIHKDLHNVVITAVERKSAHSDYTFTDLNVTFEHDGETKTINLRDNDQCLSYRHEITTALEAAQFLNEQEAKGCDHRAAQILGYIKWQEERVANWVLRELTPVVDVTKTVGGGDQKLLKALGERDGEPMFVSYFSRGFSRTRNGQYTQAQKLAKLGLVEVEEVKDVTHYRQHGCMAKLTEAGKAHLAAK